MKKHHTKSFLKVVLLKKGRKRHFSLSICILNENNVVKKKLGFFAYENRANFFFKKLLKGNNILFFLDYFFIKKWIIKSLKFSYKISSLFKIMNIL